MSARQYHRIYPVLKDEIVKIVSDRKLHYVAVSEAFFYERHECRTRHLEHLDVAPLRPDHLGVYAALYRYLRSDYADAVERRAAAYYFVSSRLYYAHDRYIGISFGEVGSACGTDGIAGYDYHLHAAFHQKIGDLIRKVHDRLYRFRSVRRPCRVTEINEPFLRKPLNKIRDAGQSSKSRVEHTYRSVIHLLFLSHWICYNILYNTKKNCTTL